MNARIDGTTVAMNAGAMRPVAERPVAPAAQAKGSPPTSLRRELGSAFETAYQLDQTNEVLSTVRERLVTLRAGMQLAGTDEEQRALIRSTLQGLKEVVDMAEFGPVQWPDAPPKERDPNGVTSPLQDSLASSFDSHLAAVRPEEAETLDLDVAAGGALSTRAVDQAILEVDSARRRVESARFDITGEAAGLVSHRLRASNPSLRPVDSDRAEVTARQLKESFTSNPQRSMEAVGELDPEAVLSLVV